MNKYAPSLIAWTAIVLTPAITVADEPSSACVSNFAVEGSFFTGRKYNSQADFPGVSMAEAYTRIYAAIVQDGWVIVQADMSSGVISATEQVSYSKAAQAPLTTIVQAISGGSKAVITLRTAGGHSAGLDVIRSKLCRYLQSAAAPSRN